MSKSDLKVEKTISRSEALLKFIEEAVFDKVPNFNDPEIANRKKIWNGVKRSSSDLTDEEFILQLANKMNGLDIANFSIIHEFILRITNQSPFSK